MDSIIPIVIIATIIAIIGGAVYIAHRIEKKRSEVFEQAATEMGLTFHARQVEALRFPIADFRLFNTGRSREFKNILVADTPEARIGIFDYEYTTGGGKNSRTHRQSVAVIESAGLQIPEFTLRPEVRLFDAIGNMIGFQDIDFDDHPEFSQAFVLKSPAEVATREMFDRPLLDFFAQRTSMAVEARPGAVIYFRTGKRIKPTELRDFFSQAFAVYKALQDRVHR